MALRRALERGSLLRATANASRLASGGGAGTNASRLADGRGLRCVDLARLHSTKSAAPRPQYTHNAASASPSLAAEQASTLSATPPPRSPMSMATRPAAAPPPSTPLSASALTSTAKATAAADGMPRWPSVTSPGGLLRALDWVGTVSFAHSGAVLAASMGMDLLGTAAVGTITAVGGGTIRDALFLSRAPFWTSEVEYLALCSATAAATFLLWPRADSVDEEENILLFTGDTLGVAAFCVIGAQNGVRAGMPFAVSVLCGMATATFGGAVRDVLCKRDVRIFHSHAEIYATTAASGATAYLVARSLAAPPAVSVATGLATAGMLRYMAWQKGIRLPVWKKEDAQ